MAGQTTPAIRRLNIVGACSLAIWISAAGVSFHYDGTRPEVPNPVRGQIYELNTHGHVVYISFRDGVLFYGMMLIAVVGAVTSIAISQRIQRSRRSGYARYQNWYRQ